MQQMQPPGGQPQMPNFNGMAVVPMAGALEPADNEKAFNANRRLRELYVLNGPLTLDLANIVTDHATSLIYLALGIKPITEQTFISVPSVLLDPNLRGTQVLRVVDKLIADSIEQHHKFVDDVKEAAQQDGAANE